MSSDESGLRNHDSPPALRSSPPPWYRDVYLWLGLLLALPVVGPLLQPGYFWGGHDARHSVYFLHQFDKVFRDGVLYPRWIPDMAFGYGYPFFNVYGPLASYTGEVFLQLGFDIVTAVKIVFGLSAVLSGLTMYLFVRGLLGRPAGLIAALVYVYIPYHLFDLYVRADLAESVAFVFVPLVLWGFYEAVNRPRLAAILWAALAYAALMFTHSLSAFILTALMGLYVVYMIGWRLWEARGKPKTEVVNSHRTSRIKGYVMRIKHNSYTAAILSGFPPLLVLVLGLGLSAVYLFPAIVEAGYVRTDQWFGGRFAFGDDFVELFQLFSPQWGFGASIPGPDDDIGFQIGLAALILFILSFLIVPRLTDTRIRHTFYFFQAVTIWMALLTVPLSILVWELLPLAQLVQFPWRLLVTVAPFISIVAGAILADAETDRGHWSVAGGQMPISVIILSSLILLSSYPYLQAEVRDPKPTEGPVSVATLFRFQQSSEIGLGASYSQLVDLGRASGGRQRNHYQSQLYLTAG